MIVKFILSKGLETEELRNEIYCQIVKQMGDNPKGDQVLKAWELLAFCSGTFVPGDNLLKVVLTYSYIIQIKNSSILHLFFGPLNIMKKIHTTNGPVIACRG